MAVAADEARNVRRFMEVNHKLGGRPVKRQSVTQWHALGRNGRNRRLIEILGLNRPKQPKPTL